MEDDDIELFRRSIIENFKLEFDTMKDDDVHFIEEMADMVIKEFKGSYIVDDDDVNPEIRDVLYLLEGMGLLKMDITEKHIIDGRVWRNHFWVMNKRHLDRIQNRKKKMGSVECIKREPSMIYKQLPDEFWNYKDYSRNDDWNLGTS